MGHGEDNKKESEERLCIKYHLFVLEGGIYFEI